MAEAGIDAAALISPGTSLADQRGIGTNPPSAHLFNDEGRSAEEVST